MWQKVLQVGSGGSGGGFNISDLRNCYNYISDTSNETKTYTVTKAGVYFASACGYNNSHSLGSTGTTLFSDSVNNGYCNYAFYKCNVGDTITVSIINPYGTSSITIWEIGNINSVQKIFAEYKDDSAVSYTHTQNKGDKYLVLLAPSGRDEQRKHSENFGDSSFVINRMGTYTYMAIVDVLLENPDQAKFTCNGYGYGGGCIVLVNLK